MAGLVLPAPEAAAQIDCISAYGSLFDGFISNVTDTFGHNYLGTAANMINNTAPICDTGSQDPQVNFIFVWDMIHDNNAAPGGTAANYAQMGFYRGYNQCMYFTDEWNRYPYNFVRNIHTEYGCLNANSVNLYWVQYVPNDSCTGHNDIRLNVDTTIMNCTPFDPATSWPGGDGPWMTEFSGETKYLGSSIPSSNIAQMLVQLSNDNWTNALPVFDNICQKWPVRYINSGFPNGTNSFGINTSGNSVAYTC